MEENAESRKPGGPPTHLIVLGVLALLLGVAAGVFMSFFGTRP
jgi:hypothetical protein